MNKRLLTLDDLYKFYSTKKKSMKFSSEKSGEPIVVQVDGKMSFSNNEDTEGLTAVTLQACHTEKNLNASSISFDTMQNKMLPTFKNRPILGYIHEVNGQPEFYGHNMHIDPDTEEIVYEEIAVGIIPETNNAKLEYDSKNDRYNVIVDGYLFDDYTKAKSILEREQECYVSVEISIREMSYSVKDKCLNIEDGYFSGVTILGRDESGKKVMPGMANSNIKLKDFAESNNSMFSDMTEDEHTKLVDTLEKLNKTLENISKFNIDKPTENEEGGVNVKKEFEDNENETVVENESEVIETEKCKPKKKNEVEGAESGEAETVDSENTESETFDDGGDAGDGGSDDSAESADEPVENEEPTEGDGTGTGADGSENSDDGKGEELEISSDQEEPDEDEEDDEDDNSKKKQPFSKTFELSHDDIRSGLYALLREYEEADNDWYWIVTTYDNHFIYQSCCTGAYWGQKYTKDGDNVAFDGERYEMFNEFLTKSEKENLENMRSNYSSIQEELNTYKEAELNSQREAVFNDEAYAEFVDTASFKEIKEKINTYSLDELRTACDLAFAKEVKSKGVFVLKDSEKKEEKKASFFMFSKQEQNTSFLDSLLKK